MVKSIKVMDAQVMKVIMMSWHFLFGVNVCLFVFFKKMEHLRGGLTDKEGK